MCILVPCTAPSTIYNCRRGSVRRRHTPPSKAEPAAEWAALRFPPPSSASSFSVEWAASRVRLPVSRTPHRHAPRAPRPAPRLAPPLRPPPPPLRIGRGAGTACGFPHSAIQTGGVLVPALRDFFDPRRSASRARDAESKNTPPKTGGVQVLAGILEGAVGLCRRTDGSSLKRAPLALIRRLGVKPRSPRS